MNNSGPTLITAASRPTVITAASRPTVETAASGPSLSVESVNDVPKEAYTTSAVAERSTEPDWSQGDDNNSRSDPSMPRAHTTSHDSSEDREFDLFESITYDNASAADNMLLQPTPRGVESPRAYVLPKAVMNHQDSFTDSECSVDAPEAVGSPRRVAKHRRAGSDGFYGLNSSSLAHVKVSRSATAVGSPRSSVYPRISGSPKADGCRTIARMADKDGGDLEKALIDTAAPFESVKQAVSKFGGITDWKAHKMETVERRKFVEEELEKIQQKILPEYVKRSADAEEEKRQILDELLSTKRLVEELKFDLERAQTEELQARQDVELAKLRVEEMEQGIAEEASVATKAQLEVAKARHLAAASELQSVKEELQALKEEYEELAAERDVAVRRAEEAVNALKDVEKTVEELSIQFIATKESLESAHAAHLEAEEQKISEAEGRYEDIKQWKKELEEAEEQIGRLNEELRSARELEFKLNAASALLDDLKAEMEVYTKMKQNNGTCEDPSSSEKGGILMDSLVEVTKARKDLEEVNSNIERERYEVNILKDTVSSLKTALEGGKSSVEELKQRERMASIADASVESEIYRTESDISAVKINETETREKIRRAVEEADDARTLAKTAREELRRAQEEAEEANAGFSAVEMKLRAAQEEIETARASEKVALETFKAMKQREKSTNEIEFPNSVVVPLDEYQELAQRAHEAEQQANVRLREAVAKIEVAKDEEMRSLEMLEEVNREIVAKKEELKAAMENAEKAREGKLGAEQELRNWRAKHEEQRRKAWESFQGADASKSPEGTAEIRPTWETSSKPAGDANVTRRPRSPFFCGGKINANPDESPDHKEKKKRPLFPRLFMFLARRKSHK